MKEIKHGTTTAYATDRCRCDICTKFWREYMKAYRAARTGSDGPHGDVSTYANLGCRCDPCKRAIRDYWRDYRARKRATS